MKIGAITNVQDHAVISTVPSLESGFPAKVDIGNQVTIGAFCVVVVVDCVCVCVCVYVLAGCAACLPHFLLGMSALSFYFFFLSLCSHSLTHTHTHTKQATAPPSPPPPFKTKP